MSKLSHLSTADHLGNLATTAKNPEISGSDSDPSLLTRSSKEVPIHISFKNSPRVLERFVALLITQRCYTTLFPSTHTWWLLAVIICLNGIDWAAFEVLNVRQVLSKSSAHKVMAGLDRSGTL